MSWLRPVVFGIKDQVNRLDSAGAKLLAKAHARRTAGPPRAVQTPHVGVAPELDPLMLDIARAVGRRQSLPRRDKVIDVGVVVRGLPENRAARQSIRVARRSTVSRVGRSYMARKAQFRDVINHGRSGPGARPGQGPIRMIDRSEVIVQWSRERSASNRCRATLEGMSSIAAPPAATAHCESAISPRPSSALSAVPPVISRESTRRQTGRSTESENNRRKGSLGRGWVVTERNSIRSPANSPDDAGEVS